MKDLLSENKKPEISEHKSSVDGSDLVEEQHGCSSNTLGHKISPVEKNVIQKFDDLEICAEEFPGSSATYRILEVISSLSSTWGY